MRINDFIMFIPNAVMAVFLNTIRVNIDDISKQEILKNGLYHITPNEEVSKKIVESQHFKPARGPIKNLNSYGTACVCFFDGLPSVENYMKNLLEGQSNNPYINPTIAVPAVKVSPKEKEELVNYKSRALEDNAILFEGYCVLPEDEIKTVHLVPDLVRNQKTGEPIKNIETGKYEIAFREALEEELSEDRKSYKAKEDYLKFMEEEKERLGYMKGNNVIARVFNSISSVFHVTNIEGNMSRKNVITNLPKIIKRKFQQLVTPKLDMSTDEKIYSSINEFDTSKKNPYRDKRFGEKVAELQTKGLKQLKLKEELEKLTTSDAGKYFRQKHNKINQNQKSPSEISHYNRVAMYAMLIAQKEGMLEKDTNNRTKDLLLNSVYYKYMDNENKDNNLLKAIITASQKKDNKVNKILKKCKIDKADIEYVSQLINVIKDAYALDRTRLDLSLPIAVKTNLNPEFLRLDTSKQLLNISYQLENLSKKVSFDRILAYKTQEQLEGGNYENKREQFIDYLRQGIVQKVRKNIHKAKTVYNTKFTGNHAISNVKKNQKLQEDEGLTL